MLIGIGIDSVETERVARKCIEGTQGPCPSRFMEKMFTPREIERSLRNQRSPYQHLAACFAAREAFFKATQVWYRRQKVSIAQETSGEPYYVLHPALLPELREACAFNAYGALPLYDATQIRVSLTHDDTYCTAIAICERLPKALGLPGLILQRM